tara:strand:+ start:5306 stop:6256 length:951 start_codon:yes stop_codon:yes gene_type:complete
MKYKCFVTGGAGLIGLSVCRELLKRGHEVYLYDLGEQVIRNKTKIPKNVNILIGSILDKHTLTTSMKNCDYVFHLAAMLGVKYTEDNKLSCLEVNCTGTKNVLEAATTNKVKKFIFASSSEVYGEPDTNPISEKNSTKGKTIYGISKINGEEYCKAYRQKYSLNYTILRFFNTYGPNQDEKFVITKFIRAALNNQHMIINGYGNQKRSYTYVDDSARATVIAAFNKKTNQKIYNVGNGDEPITLKELAAKVARKLKKKVKIKYKKNFSGSDRSKDREIFIRYCDSSKIKRAINWKPLVKVDEGIVKIVKSIKDAQK